MSKERSNYFNNKGIEKFKTGDYQNALELFQKALRENPENSQAKFNIAVLFNNIASTHYDNGELGKAIDCLKKSVWVNPSYSVAYSNILEAQANLCRWQQASDVESKLLDLAQVELEKSTKTGITPFLHLTRVQNSKKNLAIAKSWSDDIHGVTSPMKNKKKHKKIRIGYATNGFRDFPTAYNFAGVLENHDKSKFEIYYYIWGEKDESSIRKRILKYADKIRDITSLSDKAAAKSIHKDNLDILVDMKGYTKGNRMPIFAHKPTPIIVSLLGFVGTTGSNFHDFIIADKFVIPPQDQKYFSEKVAYMPDTYWPTDNKIKVSRKKFKREDFGLPKDQTVFVSFATSYKITPEVFDVWVQILKNTPGSVLWLWERNKEIRANLEKEARKRGLDKDRLVFSKHALKPKHLKRLELADIALDTWIVNGHTTTTDALWMGVPVITKKGKHFASRVSESILNAIKLPELICEDKREYINLASSLGNNKAKIKRLKNKLNKNKKSTPLFNTQKYTRNLERAYLNMLDNA